jgi:hypothetical protein
LSSKYTLIIEPEWDASKHKAFNNNIDKEKLNGLYNEIVNTLIDDIDTDIVNSFVSELCNLLIDIAKTTLGTHKYKTRPDTFKILLYKKFIGSFIQVFEKLE